MHSSRPAGPRTTRRARRPGGVASALLQVLAVSALIAASVSEAEASPEVTWRAPVEVAAGGGYRGPWRMNRSVYDYVDDPTVAFDETGELAVAWVDQEAKDIFFRRYASDGTAHAGAPVNVSRTPGVFSWLPRLRTAEGGRAVYTLWQEIVFSGGSHGGEVFFARSTDGGESFDSPINLSNSRAGDGKGRLTEQYWHNGSLDLAVAASGTIYAAWTEYDGRLWFSRSSDGGKSFSSPLRVSGSDAAPARGPSLAVEDGVVYLAWTVGEDAAADIHIATSPDGGRRFAAPRAIAASDGHSDAPKIAVDTAGVVHLVYAESPEGPFRPSHIRYARSADGGQSFTEPMDISGAQAGQYESLGFPYLAAEGEGNLYVAWELFPRLGRRSRGLGFTVSGDGGDSFVEPSVVPGTADPANGVNGSQQGLLMRKLAVGPEGALAIVNSTYRRGEESRIWLHLGRVLDR